MRIYQCRGYRLPTEAEWEYAARSGTTKSIWTPNGGGDLFEEDIHSCAQGITLDDGTPLEDIAWFCANAEDKTHEVGQKIANAWGLYDMHGNVWEWCEDVWHENYKGAPTDGSAWIEGGAQGVRVLRGGSWISLALALRSAYRYRNYRDNRFNDYGFRLARTL